MGREVYHGKAETSDAETPSLTPEVLGKPTPGDREDVCILTPYLLLSPGHPALAEMINPPNPLQPICVLWAESEANTLRETRGTRLRRNDLVGGTRGHLFVPNPPVGAVQLLTKPLYCRGCN